MIQESIVVGRRAVQIEKLQYFILPGKFGSRIQMDLFKKIFSFWKQQWEPLFRSITGVNQIKSDEFLRQFEITALLYEGEVIGILCLDLFDLDNVVHLDHSYFSWLQSEDLGIFNKFGYSLVINQLAVSKMWRGEYGIADLLVGLACKRMENSPYERTICYTRNFKKTDSLAQRWGARVILKDQIVHNEPSTYFEFPKFCSSQCNHPLTAVVDQIWKNATNKEQIHLNRINFVEINTNEGMNYAKERNQ